MEHTEQKVEDDRDDFPQRSLSERVNGNEKTTPDRSWNCSILSRRRKKKKAISQPKYTVNPSMM
jgi:hypothetical protein